MKALAPNFKGGIFMVKRIAIAVCAVIVVAAILGALFIFRSRPTSEPLDNDSDAVVSESPENVGEAPASDSAGKETESSVDNDSGAVVSEPVSEAPENDGKTSAAEKTENSIDYNTFISPDNSSQEQNSGSSDDSPAQDSSLSDVQVRDDDADGNWGPVQW